MDIVPPPAQETTMKMILRRFSQDENQNHAAAEVKVDPSFRKLIKNSISFHIWRVDDDRIEPICKSNYGTFYNDGSYIIYASCPNGTYVNQETITRETKLSCGIERYIHFWLGELVTTQKSGRVAFKVMELDTYLSNIATQYREAQDNESPRFLSYFKDGIFILPGNRDESISDGTKLYLVKGRNSFRCIEMAAINWDYFCSDVIMILKTPLIIFIWVGRSSHPSERLNGIKVAKKFQNTHEIIEMVIIDDGYEQTMNEQQKQCWNNYLPLGNRFINQTMTIEKPISNSYKLYECGYVDGRYRIVELKSSHPLQADLRDSESTYILDGFSLGVWVWVGKNSQVNEKAEAMRNARGFMKKKKYPTSTSLIRVIDGHEPLEFIRLFPSWKYVDFINCKLSHILGKLDSLTLSQRPKMAAQSQLIDDGSGEKRIFRFAGGIQLVELPEPQIQWFYTDNSYVVHYTVANISTSNISNSSFDLVGIENIVYVWTGKQATAKTIKVSQSFASNYLKKINCKTIVVFIEENYETPHFLQLFQGKFIVLLSDTYNNINNNNNNNVPCENQLLNDTIIVQVQGDCKFNAKSNEVKPMVVMKSTECYVIKSKNIWVWCGNSSTGDCREIAKAVGSVFGDYTLIIELKEPELFWSTVSNQVTLAKNGNARTDNGILNFSTEVFNKSKIQLHLVIYKNGNITTQEILAFEQSDLKPENVYILDVITIIYIWVGKHCLPIERENITKVPEHFFKMSLSRGAKTAVGYINQGEEPNLFTGFFDVWDRKFWLNHIQYEKCRGHLSKTMSVSPKHVSNQENDFDLHTKYPLSVLKADLDTLPGEVDPIRKEVHLTHDDFVALFDMPFSEFNSLPFWKKQELKKKYKLF